jgi:crotonobetainyl-CoA:carnitine CoA-transferase CaiB-like acyl-CoA transferase
MRVEIPHESAGILPIIANPLRFSATPLTEYNAPPELGEHGAVVLADLLGYSLEKIDSLRQLGVMG